MSNRWYKNLSILLLAILIFAYGTAQAACVNPAGNAAKIIFNKDYKALQYCDDTNWRRVGPKANPIPSFCDAIGDHCSEGSVYAGMSSDGNIKMFVTPCDVGEIWDGAACTGAADTPAFGAISNRIFVDATSTTDGDGNTFKLSFADASTSAGFQVHAAAQACQDLVALDHDDWYLPSSGEYGDLYTSRAQIGNFGVNHYWTSTEVDASSALRKQFDTGATSGTAKSNGFRVRCARKDGRQDTSSLLVGLVGWWKLDEISGTSAIDSSSSNNGTMLGGLDASTDSVSGRIRTALDFNGSSDRVSIADQPELNNTDWTISSWFSIDATSGDFSQRIIAKETSNSSKDFYMAVGNATLRLICSYEIGGNEQLLAAPVGTEMSLQKWYHGACVYDSGTNNVYMYIDGALVAQRNGGAFTPPDTAAPLEFGRKSFSNSDYFNGQIDDVRLYNRALTVEEIAELYRSRDGHIDYNADFRVPEYFNGENWAAMGEKKYIPNAVEFDGTNDYLTRGAGLTGVADGKKITASFWSRFNSYPSASFEIAGSNPPRFRIVYSGNGTETMQMTLRDTANASNTNIGCGPDPHLAGVWYHHLISVDVETGAANCYVDDVDSKQTFTAPTDATIDFTVSDFSVGATPAASSKLDGQIADLWIDFGTYIDFSVEANRRKFIDENGAPVYLGASGSIPTGSAPDIYLTGDTVDWHTNKGTGGGFTENGALTDADGPNKSIPSLSIVGSIAPDTTNLEKIEYIKVVGAHAFVVSYTDDHVAAVNVSDPTSPFVEINKVTGINAAQNFDIVGNYLYISALRTTGPFVVALHVIDISDPANMTQVGTVLSTSPILPQSTVVSGDYAYSINLSGSTEIFNISNPASPVFVKSASSAQITGYSNLMYNGYYYAIDAEHICAWNASDPENLTLTNCFGDTDTSITELRDVAASGGYLYVVDKQENKLIVIDVSSPAADLYFVTELADTTGELDGPEGVFLYGDYLYVTSTNTDTLAVFDVSDPTNPRFIDKVSDGTDLDGSDDVFVADHYAYVGNSVSGMAVIDIGNKCANPTRAEGSLIYNSDLNVMQYCDGVNWRAVGP